MFCDSEHPRLPSERAFIPIIIILKILECLRSLWCTRFPLFFLKRPKQPDLMNVCSEVSPNEFNDTYSQVCMYAILA